MPRLAIIVIGNEILSGKVDEQNARFAIGYLRSIGADLERICMIPDVCSAIAREVRYCAETFDWVITSGGVGPTHDDLTYEGVAEAFGVGLRANDHVAEMLRNYFGGKLTDDHLRMAAFPEGSEVEFFPDLPIPVVRMRNVYVLPGIPQLFRRALECLGSRLAGQPVVVREVYCAQDEGEIASALRAIQQEFADLQLGSYPRFDGDGRVTVRITIEGRDSARVMDAERKVRTALGL